MILASLTLLATASVAPAQDTTTFSFEAPSIYVEGEPFPVSIEIETGPAASPVAAWLLKESAFLVDGESVGTRMSDQFVTLPPGASMSLDFDLAPFLSVDGDFELGYGNAGGADPIAVTVLQRAPADLDYMTVDEATLGNYMIVVSTNRGTMLWEMWPELAPNHVRNFLDLYASGFYDQTLFHRVGQGFMIQGGDPNTKDPTMAARWGMGGGPRQLEAEFSDKPHVRGILSTARSADPNSASSQFFVMHGRAASLDRQYSVFGSLLDGHAESFSTLDAIATADGQRGPDGTVRPGEPQRIERATIVMHPDVSARAERASGERITSDR